MVAKPGWRGTNTIHIATAKRHFSRLQVRMSQFNYSIMELKCIYNIKVTSYHKYRL